MSGGVVRATEADDRLPLGPAYDHLAALAPALEQLEADVARLARWGGTLAGVLAGGGRLLAVGNGGSAAQAQHLTSELVGRFEDERRPFSAIALHAETSSVTAIGNDYGPDAVFARQVAAHGRPGDVLVALSTSGRSPNVMAAAGAARGAGLRTWAVTGPRPNPLAEACDDAVCVDAATVATVQEVHLVVVHLLCRFVDAAVRPPPDGRPAPVTVRATVERGGTPRGGGRAVTMGTVDR